MRERGQIYVNGDGDQIEIADRRAPPEIGGMSIYLDEEEAEKLIEKLQLALDTVSGQNAEGDTESE